MLWGEFRDAAAYRHASEQPGWLRLERAAAEASARAKHSTVAGALLRFGVCCELLVRGLVVEHRGE